MNILFPQGFDLEAFKKLHCRLSYEVNGMVAVIVSSNYSVIKESISVQYWDEEMIINGKCVNADGTMSKYICQLAHVYENKGYLANSISWINGNGLCYANVCGEFVRRMDDQRILSWRRRMANEQIEFLPRHEQVYIIKGEPQYVHMPEGNNWYW